jgi:hypothetical protein
MPDIMVMAVIMVMDTIIIMVITKMNLRIIIQGSSPELLKNLKEVLFK